MKKEAGGTLPIRLIVPDVLLLLNLLNM
ncbi:hypothetical protein LINPERHAP2_LOCUS29616 [Linum perenne]